MTLEQKLQKMLRHMNEHCECDDCLYREGKLARNLVERIARVYLAGYRDGGRMAPHRASSALPDTGVAAFVGEV